jgi:hypothetical protein
MIAIGFVFCYFTEGVYDVQEGFFFGDTFVGLGGIICYLQIGIILILLLLFEFLLFPLPFFLLARNSKTMLNRSEESGHPCLAPHFRGNGFSFSHLV